MSFAVPVPDVYFSFDDMTGITPHGSVNITIDEDVSAHTLKFFHG